MDEFDRRESAPKEKETRKAIIALVLGMVLIAIMVRLYLRRPSGEGAGAPAATGSGAAAPLEADMSEAALAKLKAELQNDPTATLLLTNAPVTAQVAQMPRNPFRMAPAWASRLTRPPEVVVKADPPPQTMPQVAEPPATLPRPDPPSLRAADYRLQSLLIQGGQRSAIINSRVVHAGDVIAQARVLEIRDNSVILQHVDALDGPRLEIAMPGIMRP